MEGAVGGFWVPEMGRPERRSIGPKAGLESEAGGRVGERNGLMGDPVG
jgi:hypothetical protein